MRHAAGVLAVCMALAAASARSSEIPPDEARRLLDALAGPSGADARAALARIEEKQDARFVAPLIELMRASEIGIAAPAAGAESARTLAVLTGEQHGLEWSAWTRWYAGTTLAPPPGFVGWKGALLARKDPNFASLLREGAPSRIRVEEIVWGGVAYEGIPALDHPAVQAASQATWLGRDDPVFGVAHGGEARAYPLRILDWHELANDTLGGESIALAYCTLCGTGIAYRARLPDGRKLDFGSSGLLMRSNKLMVDRQTRTLWNQFTGQPVLGPLAESEIELAMVPSVVARWSEWREQHPDTTVITPATGHQRNYEPGAAYGGYFASPRTMFPAPRARTELPDKERVFGIRIGAAAKAYRLADLAARKVVNDAVGDTPVVLVASRGTITVSGQSLRDGPARWDAGGEARAYRRGEHRFASGPNPDALRDEAGRSWQLTEDALVGPTGERAERVAGVLSYWFGWAAFVPRTELWKAL